jgi:hypothetical protein
MAPEMLRIGDYSYKPPKASHPFGFLKFGKKDNLDNKNTPMIAYVYKSEINLKPITKELLDGFTL